MALNSFKGWQIDLDPINVYFWVFAGFLLKLGYLDRLNQKSVGDFQLVAKVRQRSFVGIPIRA